MCGDVALTYNFSIVLDLCGPIGSHTVIFAATDECGNVSLTQATLNIIDSIVTNISNPIEFNFKVYPNPASDVLHVLLDNDNSGQMYLRLTDAFGKLHWSETN